jgi:hypothetical protein
MICAVSLSMAFVNNAHAHAKLVSAVPAAGSMAPVPTELKLKFSERLELKFSGVEVIGAMKWFLARDLESGQALVRHDPNPASGGESVARDAHGTPSQVKQQSSHHC